MIKQIATYLRGSVSAYGLFAIWKPTVFRRPEPVSKYDQPPVHVGLDHGSKDYSVRTNISRDGVTFEVGTVPQEVWDGLKPANEA